MLMPGEEQYILEDSAGRFADRISLWNRVHFWGVGELACAVRLYSRVKLAEFEKQLASVQAVNTFVSSLTLALIAMDRVLLTTCPVKW
ncbi:hypothetical protein NECAME_14359 [Necator americanus]|uniref:Uncharacterized protein n=1 Tax=Necator americanus TaxID=51031 RepID=W2SQA8_NECAM|nr:hypothetical protein NECAME_14359 [Necator americanus]ETN71071.1 hypothetical protein NECAME_14359 [Necator americanus]